MNINHSKPWAGALLTLASLPGLAPDCTANQEKTPPAAGVNTAVEIPGESQADYTPSTQTRLSEAQKKLEEVLAKGKEEFLRNQNLKAGKQYLEDEILPLQETALHNLDGGIAYYEALIELYEQAKNSPPPVAEKPEGVVDISQPPLPGTIEIAVIEDIQNSGVAVAGVLQDIAVGKKPDGKDIVQAIMPPDPVDILPDNVSVAKRGRDLDSKIRSGGSKAEKEVRKFFRR